MPLHAELHGARVRLNDFGSEDVAYFAIPSETPRGGVVLIHDREGLTDAFKQAVDDMARDGYIAVAPDLYNGEVASDALQAETLGHAFATPSALQTVVASIRFLRESPRFHAPEVAVVGWGWGGPMAVRGAREMEENTLSALVLVGFSFLNESKRIEPLRMPILALIDPVAPRELYRPFVDAMIRQRKHIEFEELPTGGVTSSAAWRKISIFLERRFSAPTKHD